MLRPSYSWSVGPSFPLRAHAEQPTRRHVQNRPRFREVAPADQCEKMLKRDRASPCSCDRSDLRCQCRCERSRSLIGRGRLFGHRLEGSELLSGRDKLAPRWRVRPQHGSAPLLARRATEGQGSAIRWTGDLAQDESGANAFRLEASCCSPSRATGHGGDAVVELLWTSAKRCVQIRAEADDRHAGLGGSTRIADLPHLASAFQSQRELLREGSAVGAAPDALRSARAPGSSAPGGVCGSPQTTPARQIVATPSLRSYPQVIRPPGRRPGATRPGERARNFR